MSEKEKEMTSKEMKEVKGGMARAQATAVRPSATTISSQQNVLGTGTVAEKPAAPVLKK